MRWKIKRRHSSKVRSTPALVQEATSHCFQAQIPLGDLSGWLTKLTGQLHINGLKWQQGSSCRYRLPTDNASQRALRIGVLLMAEKTYLWRV